MNRSGIVEFVGKQEGLIRCLQTKKSFPFFLEGQKGADGSQMKSRGIRPCIGNSVKFELGVSVGKKTIITAWCFDTTGL